MSASSPTDNGNPIHAVLRALRHRNYRLFFSGQILSLIGTWITVTTTAWLVYQLSHSAFMLGVTGFAGQLPAFVLAPVAGVYVDRWNRHRLLVVTQILSMLQSFALAGLTLTGHITVPLIVALNAFQGLVNAFDMPGRQSFVIAMIEDKRDLGNAIALNSSMFNAARLIGPSAAGLIIAAVGAGWAYLLDGISYLAVIVALLAMRVPAPAAPHAPHAGPFQAMHAGWRYVVGSLPIRSIMLLLALVSLVGGPYTVLMPIFATRILGGGSYTLGLLLSAIGCGALGGALWLAARRSVLGLGRLIPMATVVFGCGLIAFSFSRSLWLSLLILVVTGIGFMLQIAASNTLVQTIVDEHVRGRVMSFYMMAFLGTAPFGSLFAGALAARIGAPYTLLASGLCCLLGAAWFARQLGTLRAAVRPIYVEKGILPEMARGVQVASEASLPPEEE